MPASRSNEPPCVHCGTPLNEACRFCFECGAPVVPELRLPNAPPGAAEELRTAAFTPVSIPLRDDEDAGLRPGEAIEIESLQLDVVVEEVPIELDDDTEIDDEPGPIGDLHGTVVAMAPEHPMPFWPAPPKGETVIAPPPTRPRVAG